LKQAVSTQWQRFWTHARSPITLRAFMAFLAVTALFYIAWRDINQYVVNRERNVQMDEQFDEWQRMHESTSRSLAIAERNTHEAAATSQMLKELSTAIHEMAEELKQARAIRDAEHAEITRQLKANADNISATARANRARRRTAAGTASNNCWRLVESAKPFGGTNVVTKEYRRVPCN
jgi:septal ring factor EnvC (AmiA/AmiB activator)